MTKRWQN